MGKRDKLNPVIYCIFNKLNSKRYIGSATRDKERWRAHRHQLRGNYHFSTHLQSAWNKYGEENFEFQIIEKIEFEKLSNEELISVLKKQEEYWIKKYKTTDRKFGYNSRVECDTNLGLKWSEESRRKFSESKKGKPIKHLIGLNTELWKNPEYRENWRKKTKEWRNSLSEEEKKAIYAKALKTKKKRYEENKKLYGKKINPEITKKVQETYIKNGHSLRLYTYFPNGEFFKEFLTAASALRFLGEPSKNSGSITTRIDKSLFRGLIFSYTKYDKYPVNHLQIGYLQETIVTNTITGEKTFCKNMEEVWRTFHIPRGRLYSKFFTNNIYKYQQYQIEIIAPVLGDKNSKAGEFIENLYRHKDNNELSNELTSIESAETNTWNCYAEHNSDTSARQLSELMI